MIPTSAVAVRYPLGWLRTNDEHAKAIFSGTLLITDKIFILVPPFEIKTNKSASTRLAA
jgi:hypothetical protein